MMTRSKNIQRKLGLLAASLVLCMGVLAIVMPASAQANDQIAPEKQGIILAPEASSGIDSGSDKAATNSGAQTANSDKSAGGSLTLESPFASDSTDNASDLQQGNVSTYVNTLNDENDANNSDNNALNNENPAGKDADSGAENGSDDAQNTDGNKDSNDQDTAQNPSENTSGNNKNPLKNSSDDTNKNASKNNGDEAPILPQNPEGPASAPVSGGEVYGPLAPASSSDSVGSAITLSPQDSTAPPGMTYYDTSPLEDGSYFIRWERNDNFWLGVENEVDEETGEEIQVVKVFTNPTIEDQIQWKATPLPSDHSYAGLYLMQMGEYYLARGSVRGLVLVESPRTSAYWDIVPYLNDKGDTVYYFFDLTRNNALAITLDEDGNPDQLVCNGSHGSNMGVGIYPPSDWQWYITEAKESDWTISYQPNGTETGSTPATLVPADSGASIATNGYHRLGYTFVGWNTEPDGSGISYTEGQYVKGAGVLASDYSLILFAQWKETFVDITYNSGEGGEIVLGTDGQKSTTVTQTVSAANGSVEGSDDKTFEGVTALPNYGHHFVNWTVSGSVDQVPADLRNLATLSADAVSSIAKFVDEASGFSEYHGIVLSAVFGANTYTINFNSNGGKGSINPKTVQFGNSDILTRVGSLARDRYLFRGWNTIADGTGIAVTDAATLDALLMSGALNDANGSSTTLYAMWEEDPNAADPDDPNNGNNGNNGDNGNNGNDDPGNNDVPAPPAGDNGESGASESNGSSSYGSRNYGGYSRYANYYGSRSLSTADPAADAAEITEADAEVFEAATALDQQITTASNGGILGAITEFMSTDTGRVVGTVVAVGVGVAAVAGVVGIGLSIAGAGAAGAAGAAAAGAAGAAAAGAGAAGAAGAGAAAGAGGFFFRLRKRIARLFGKGDDDDDAEQGN